MLGAALIYALSALGDVSSSPDETSTPATTAAPQVTVPPTSDEVEADVPQRAPVDLLGLGGGAHIAVDEFGDAPIVADPEGFIRIAPVDGTRGILFSPTGAVWDSEEAQRVPEFENGMPIDGIDVSPNQLEGVVVFRSADGVVVSPVAGETITVPTLPESELTDLVVGDEVAYLTIEEPTADRGVSRHSVLRVTYGDDFDVVGVNLTEELGEGYNLLRHGTILADGTIVAVAADSANTMATLVEFTADSVVEIEAEETRALTLQRSSNLLARGNDLVLIDRDALVYVKSPDEAFFRGSTAPIHPILSASRNGILVSVELLAETTIVRAWFPGEEDPRELELTGRIEPLEVVSINPTEALLRTTTFEGESWLINVPFPAE